MSNEYKIYRGLSADELTLLDTVPAGAQEVLVSQSAGTRYWYGLRAVSSADVEEHNTHVLCRAEIDAAGQLLPTALPAGDPAWYVKKSTWQATLRASLEERATSTTGTCTRKIIGLSKLLTPNIPAALFTHIPITRT